MSRIDAVTRPNDSRASILSRQATAPPTGPSGVTIWTPASGSTLIGTVPVVWTTDNPVYSPNSYITIDGVVYAVVEGGGNRYLLDTTPLADGSHTLCVYAGSKQCEASGVYAGSCISVATANHYSYPNKAIHVAGSANDGCSLGDPSFAISSGVTIACWARVTTDNGVSSPLSFQSSASNNPGIVLQWISGNGFRCQVINNGSTPYNSPFRSMGTNSWHLLVGANANTGLDTSNIVYDSIDGEPKQTSTHATAGPWNAGTNKLWVGSNMGASWFAGDIDLVGFWGRMLTDAEIALLWNSGVGVNLHDILNSPALASLLTSLIWWGECDDTGGQNLADATGNGKTLLGANGTSTYTSVPGIR
jgi:hypothetical protein